MRGINHLGVLGGDYLIFNKVWHPNRNFVILHCGCSTLNHQKVCHPGVYPRCHQGIYLPLLYHIHIAAYCGGFQDQGDLSCEAGQIWDYQGYLILIIALDSVYLNPYDDVAHQSGKHIPQAYAGNLSAYEVWEGSNI